MDKEIEGMNVKILDELERNRLIKNKVKQNKDETNSIYITAHRLLIKDLSIYVNSLKIEMKTVIKDTSSSQKISSKSKKPKIQKLLASHKFQNYEFLVNHSVVWYHYTCRDVAFNII